MSNKVLVYPGQSNPYIPIVPNIPGQIVQIYTSAKISDLFESNNFGAKGKTSATFTVLPANITYNNIDLSDFRLVNSGEVFAAASADTGDKHSGYQAGSDTHYISVKELPAHEHYYYAQTWGDGNDFQYINESGDTRYWTARANCKGYAPNYTNKGDDSNGFQGRKFTTGKEGGSNAMDNRQATRYVITMVYTPDINKIGY